MNRHTAAAIAAIGLAAWLAGPAARPARARSAKKELAVDYQEKRIQDLSGSGLTVNFVFKVTNSASSPWYLTGYDYRVVVESSEYFTVRQELSPPIVIAASDSTFVALPVKVTNANLFQAVPSARGKDRLSCYLIGGLTFNEDRRPGGDRLAVACSGDFPVFRELQVRVDPLEVKDLTIGGGDMVFKASFGNQNDFPLGIASLAYTLDLGGTRVSEGRLPELKSLGPKSDREISLPLLLDFFELGNALYGELQKNSVACAFSGTAVIETDWGRFELPFSRTEDIAVQPAR